MASAQYAVKSKVSIALVLLLTVGNMYAQSDVKIYEQFAVMEREILSDLSHDTVYVINFWATWCAPCVKELPYFEALLEKNSEKPFKQILVSLDDDKKLESRVLPFLKKNNVRAF